MDTLRKPFFIVAVVLMAIIVLAELGNAAVVGALPSDKLSDTQVPSEIKDAFNKWRDDPQLNELSKPPGIGIRYLALVDGIALFTVVLMGISLLVPESVTGRVQGCATSIFALLIILAGLGLIFAALALVILMVSLLLSAPFGTIVYFVVYGVFNVGEARVILSLLMLLKLGFAVSLLLAQQRFLENIGLVLIVLTSLVGNVIVSFLHGLVPGFLVSITDAIAAIIVAVLALIWAILLLIFALIAVLKAIRPQA